MDNSYKFFENRDCKYFPCHKGLKDFNCLFCYCPMYFLSACPGKPEFIERDGKKLKVCTGCTYPHEPGNYEKIMAVLRAAVKR